MWSEQVRKYLIKPNLAFKQDCYFQKRNKQRFKTQKKFVWQPPFSVTNYLNGPYAFLKEIR